MALQQKSKTNHVKGKRERKKEARRMRLRFIDESSCGASIMYCLESARCSVFKRALSLSRSSTRNACEQPGPCSFTVDPINWLAESVLWTVKARTILTTHVQQSHTRKTGRSKKRRWSFNGFHNWMLEKRHKNVTQTFSGLNLNTINASASGLWQIKTAHKNLGCASVFMTVFICHKPSAFAFIVYLLTKSETKRCTKKSDPIFRCTTPSTGKRFGEVVAV